MKFNCGETYNDWKARREKWHLFYAWFPVRLASHDCRWLEYVWRKGSCCESMDGDNWFWEYKANDSNRFDHS